MKNQMCIFVIFFFSIPLTFAQFYDNHWINGDDLDNGDGAINGNIFNFQNTLPTINGILLNFELGFYNTTMSDAEGHLIFYSNGVKIINAQHELMENGDSLNWGDYTENHLDNYNNINRLNIVLPVPQHDSLYFIIHSRADYGPPNGILADKWLYTIIDMSKNGGLGKVIAKDQLIGTGHTIIDVNACRHANGRDWWITAQEDSASLYYRCLLTPEGITNFDTQYIGYQPPWPATTDAGGQNIFSPNGKYYVDFDARNGIRVFNFDRCTGLLSNLRQVTFPQQLTWGIGAAISPNSKFLYISTEAEILQFSLNAPNLIESMDTVAILDDFIPPPPQQTLYFFTLQLMPDGKIYITPTGNSKYLHYIANPDEKGDACNVVQHGIEVPNICKQSIPTFPNYRLYDLPGSPCDTLGIDGPVTAVEEEEVPTETKLAFKLYPNPSQENLTIEGPQMPHGETWNIAFYNALGREVQFVPYQSTGITQISLSGLPAGIYWCRVMAGSRPGFIQKITLLH